jgi:hypothetical protein
MHDYSAAQLAADVDELHAIKAESDLLKDKLAEVTRRFTEKQEKVLTILEHVGVEKAMGSRGGVAAVEVKESVKVPKDEASRELFFEYLKEQGIFENMITVHSQTLNAWYNAEVQDREVGWTVPGIEPGKIYKKIKLIK